MDTVEIVKLIKTTLLTRGDGTKDNPIRIITQYWKYDEIGILKLEFEIDPINSRKK